jgi:hypothetical protein
LRATPIVSLPADLRVEERLDLSDCDLLESLPAGFKTGALVLSRCTGLHALPEDMDVFFLHIPGCVALKRFPERGPAHIVRLNMRGCLQVRALPSWLKRVGQLDLHGCRSITELPADLRVVSWLDLADTGIRSLPESLQETPLRWRGVPVTSRIVFQPETIIVEEVLAASNVELRRVLLERMGYEKFIDRSNAESLDSDTDPGGARRLLRVPLSGDEPLVCLAVQCPSTGRRYLLRVPPTMRSCKQAAAWIAGFDDPKQYRPIAET